MEIKIDDVVHELKFTFNSFRYMRDFDISELQEMETKPFLMISICEKLLFGALNSNPKVKVTQHQVSNYIESMFDSEDDNGIDIVELMEILMEELENSGFFKKLQQTPKKKTRKK